MIRPVAHRLLEAAIRVAPSARSDWALAMMAELHHAPTAWAALSHAIGCSAYLIKETIMTTTLEPLFRWGGIAAASLWVAVKVTLLIQCSATGAIGLTTGFAVYNICNALLFAVFAIMAARRDDLRAGLAMVGVVLLIASQFALNAAAGAEGYATHQFALAVAMEDVVVWTLVFVAGLAALYAGRDETAHPAV